MSNAKGSGKDNKLTQPAKVVAQARSEANAISSQDLRQRAQKAVAMPASAVRAAMASAAKNAVPAVRVAYDVLSRLLSFVETGHALDQAFLKTIKGALDTAHAGDTITKKNITKVFNQIALLNETVIRVVSYKRTYTEVARPVDQPAKTLTKAPRQDTARAADVRTKVISKNIVKTYFSGYWTDPAELTFGLASADQDLLFGFPTSAVEGVTFNDRIAKIVSFNRPQAELLTSVDVRTTRLSKPKADIARGTDSKASTLGKPKADTLSLAELKRLNLSKLANDISRASDADKITFTKRINDFVFALESTNVQYNYTVDNYSNSAPQLTHISDTLTRLISFVRTFTDVARTTETLKRVVSKPKADTQIVSDRLTRVVSYHKVFADSEHTADVLSRIVSFNRSFTDVPRATDSRAKALTKAPFVDSSRAAETSKRTMSKPKADVARSTDSFSKVTQFSRAFSSTATSTHSVDVFSSVRQYKRTFLQTARSTDNFSKVTTFRRLPADVARAAETLKRVASKPKADTSRATDLFAKVVSYNRTKADTSRATDVFSKVFFRPRSLTDVSRATDLITAKYITKRLNSIVQATGVFVVTGYTHPGAYPPKDITKLRDIFTKLVSFIRTFNDTAKAQDTRKSAITKTAGSTYRVWSDFNELTVDFDTTQTLDTFRTEWINSTEQIGKFYSKIANKTATYYQTSGPITDFAELTFARTAAVSSTDPDFTTTTTFDQDQFFTYGQPYQADTERALISDVVTRVVQSVRSFTDVARANEVVGRRLERTVGDVRARVFDDVADLFYTKEYTLDGFAAGGTGAVIRLFNTYPTWTITIVNGGTGYVNSNPAAQYTITTPDGDNVTFRLTGFGVNNSITAISQIVGTPPRIATQSAYFTDFADLTFGTSTTGQYGYVIQLDQDLVQRSAQTFRYPGGNGTSRLETISGWSNPSNGFGGSIWQRYEEIYPTGTNTPYTVNVGPTAAEASAKVLGQEMQYTLKDRADGDTARYSDSSSKQITKSARRYLPQGVFDDYAELTFGTTYDMSLTQTLTTSWPESVSLIDITSRVTLGPTKRNRDTVGAVEVKLATLSKPKADIGKAYEVFAKTYQKSAGKWVNSTWVDYNEISLFALSPLIEMPLEYGSRFELILLPEQIGKSTTKPLHFESYIWRDFNELSFGTTRDEEITFSWYNDKPSDVVRTMDDARRVISPRKSEILRAQETLGKEITMAAIGDYRNKGQFRDWLGLFPIGETGAAGDPIMDEELLFTIHPGDRTDRYDAIDSSKKRIDKYVVRQVPAYWSDFAELTFGTVYDQELVQYQPTTRDETTISADLFRKVSTFLRTFNDAVRATDRMLLSKNGLAYSSYVLAPLSQVAKSQDATGRQIVKLAGNYKSQTSLWEDFAELSVSYDLAQYYYHPTDSTLDISRSIDQKANFFTKKAGRVQNILNVNTLDTDIFFDVDLLQTFSQDYVTEIIYTTDQPSLRYGKNKNEIIRLPEFIGKSIVKPGIGDTIVDDWALYSPLYINYFSDFEDKLQKQYPPYRIDVARTADTKANYYRKQAGFDPVLKWYTNFDYLTNDESIVTEGVYENRNNTFAQTKFDQYLDEIIYEFHEEQINTPFRFENVNINELFTRVLSSKRTFTEAPRAVDDPSFEFTPGSKKDISRATDVRSNQYNKTGGANLYRIWTDYLELDVGNQDLIQSYEPYRIEYLRTIDAYAAKFTKAKADIARSSDVSTRQIRPNKTEIIKPIELVGKFVAKPQVGDSTLTRWYDSYEILSYDPTLLTYGEIRTTRFDISRATDAVGKKPNIVPQDYKSRTWYDFNEIDIPTDLSQYWPTYGFNPANATDSAVRNLNKGLKEFPRSTDSGTVRVFSSNSYVRDTSPYYASDYVTEGVTTVTF